MKMMRMLGWALRLDLEFIFLVRGIPVGGRLSLVLRKYLCYLAALLGGRGRRTKSLMVFGSQFCYNEPLAVASLQRVYCAGHRLRGFLPETPVIVDVGANIGQFNFFAMHYLGARRVVSIEPAREACELLRQNAAVPEDSYCVAASDREGDVMFHISDESTQLSSYLSQPDGSYRESYPVPCRTLDVIADQAGVGRVDLLKIDTEGSEYDVLRSAERLLLRTSLVLVEMSVFRKCSANLFQIGSFLEQRGFELVELSPAKERRPSDLDALFKRR